MADHATANGWLTAIAAVLFDIDLGPTVQHLAPSPDALTAEERDMVAFHSFPDSMPMALTAQTSVRDSSFMFRVRRSADAPPPGAAADANDAPAQQQQRQPQPTPPSTKPRYLYGFVFCRQRTDPRLRRGGEQMSVVVLSEHPLSAALAPLADAVGPAFFGAGEPALRAAWADVCAAWPRPMPGQRVRLPLPSLIPGGDLVVCARVPQFSALPDGGGGVGGDVGGGGSSPEQQQQQQGASGSSSILSPQPSGGSGSGPHRYPSLSRRRSRSGGGGTGRSASAGSGLGGGCAEVAESGGGGGGGSADALTAAAPTAAAAAAAAAPQPPPPPPPPAATPFAAAAAPPPPPLLPQPNNNGGGSGRGGNADADAFSGLFGEYDASAVLCGAAGRHHPHHHARQRAAAAAAAAASSSALSSNSASAAAPRGLTKHAWLLWELAVTGAPLLVVAPTPTECSAAVAAAVSLSHPLPYAADFRPYYTIHDPSFRRIAAGEVPGRGQESREAAEEGEEEDEEEEGEEGEASAPSPSCPAPLSSAASTDATAPPTVLGVTNLYVLKSAPTWPNVLSVGVKESAVRDMPGGAGSGSRGGSAAASAGGAGGGGGGLLGSAVRALRRRQQGASQLLGQHTQGFWHQYRPLTRPDPALLSALAQAAALDARSPLTGDAAGADDRGGHGGDPHVLAPPTPSRQSRLFRRHFADLTLELLAPYGRYLEPGLGGRVRRWQPEELLRDCAAPGAAPPRLLARVGGSAASLRLLHGRFMRGANFAPWFAARRKPYEHLVEEGGGGGGAEAALAVAAAGAAVVPRPVGRGWLGGGGGGGNGPRAPGLATRVFSSVAAAAAAAVARGDDEEDEEEDDGDEVALVQAFVSLEEKLLRAGDERRGLLVSGRGGGGPGGARPAPPSPAAAHQLDREIEGLQTRLAELFFRLPPDARAALASSPARLALVKQAAAAAAGAAAGGGGGGSVVSAASGSRGGGGAAVLSVEEREAQLAALSLLHTASSGGGAVAEAAMAGAAAVAAEKNPK
jgi:hypothetical protein